MDRFEIEKILPTTYSEIWCAVVSVRTPENINGADVSQNATLTVRFTYAEHLPVSGLLEAAVREAERCLASATSFLAGQSAKQLQSDVQSERDAEEAARKAMWDKPFEFPLTLPEG